MALATTQAKITAQEGKGNFLFPLILVTSLFFLWGLAYGLLDVLNKHFQELLNVTKTRSTRSPVPNLSVNGLEPIFPFRDQLADGEVPFDVVDVLIEVEVLVVLATASPANLVAVPAWNA